MAKDSAPKQGYGHGPQEVQQAETVKPSVSIKRKRTEGTRKPLKASVIRRLCEPHPKRGRPRASTAAEIMYTNSQFSIYTNNYSRSSFNVSRNSSELSTRRMRAKPRRTPASKAKRRIKTKARPKTYLHSRKLSAMMEKVRGDPCSYHWLCTEMNGEIYMIMDLDTGLDDPSCFLLGRPGCSKKTRTNRRVGKRTKRRR